MTTVVEVPLSRIDNEKCSDWLKRVMPERFKIIGLHAARIARFGAALGRVGVLNTNKPSGPLLDPTVEVHFTNSRDAILFKLTWGGNL